MIFNRNISVSFIKWNVIVLFLAANQACTTLYPISFAEVVPASYYVDKRVSKVSLINLAPIQRTSSYQIVIPKKAPVPVDSVR